MGESKTCSLLGSNIWNKLHGLKATLMMITVQTALAGVSIFYKLASNDGMDLSVLIAYRYLFACGFVLPLALLIERNKRPKLTWMILLQAFLSALFGGTMAQHMFANSIVLTSATFTAAFTNLIPALTFIIAIFFRLEKLAFGTKAGKAKVIGTILGLGGAMLLTFYKGLPINIWSTHFNILHGGQHKDGNASLPSPHKPINHIFGSILALGSAFSAAVSLIVQAKMSKRYPCHYSSTALISVMGLIQTVVYAVCKERSRSQWTLHWNIRLFSVLYMGIIASGLMVTFVMSCMRMRGPLFVSIFKPLTPVLVAIAGSLLLDEQLHLGTILGSVIIIAGLYTVLWGNSKEIKNMSKLMPSTSLNDERENKKDDASSIPTTPTAANIGDGGVALTFISTANEDVRIPDKCVREKHDEIVEEEEEEEEKEKQQGKQKNGGICMVEMKDQKL